MTVGSMVPVPCFGCGRSVFRTPAEWNDLSDAGGSADCGECGKVVAVQRTWIGREIVLRAVHTLLQNGTSEPSEPEIVVAAWRLAPRRLGLKGYHASYPDSNRIKVELVRLVSPFGLLERPRTAHYRLTDKGLRAVRKLIADPEAGR